MDHLLSYKGFPQCEQSQVDGKGTVAGTCRSALMPNPRAPLIEHSQWGCSSLSLPFSPQLSGRSWLLFSRVLRGARVGAK